MMERSTNKKRVLGRSTATLLEESVNKRPTNRNELRKMLLHYGTVLEARDITVNYVVVNNPSSVRGIWRVAGTKLTRLTDCYVEIVRVTKPLATSTSRDYSFTMKCINPYDKTLELTLSKYDLDSNVLEAQFLMFGSLPETPLQKNYLMEAIKELMRLPGTQCQRQTDTLGWQVTEGGSLVWVASNGVETEDSFLQKEEAPFIAPSFLSPGNGYYSGVVNATPNDEVMRMLFQELLPDGQVLIASLLGIAAKIMLPSEEGMLRFASEIIGPSRHGKSRLLNAMLSLFGTQFTYDKGTLLNEYGGSDSKIGRLSLAALMKNCLFADFDHKVLPSNSLFEKIHVIRASTNNIYSDNTGGGTVGTQHGGRRTRFKPVGALVRTSNYDHSEYSLRHNEENIEARVCSFVWPTDSNSDSGYQHANDFVSHKIEKQRFDIYVWGNYYRRWIMHMHNSQKLDGIISSIEEVSRKLVYDFSINDQVWQCDLHRNQCVDIVAGILMWKQFLLDCFPESFMITWIDELLEQIIADRLARCIYVHSMANNYSETNKLTSFVLGTVRHALQNQVYITNKNKMLQSHDVPIGLDKLGYKRNMKPGKCDNYEPLGLEIGCLVKNELVAFDKTLLYDLLVENDKSRMLISDIESLNKQMVDLKIALVDKDGKSTMPVKYKQKTRRMVVIPLNVLYPSDIDTDAVPIEDYEEDNKLREQDEALAAIM